MRLKILIFIEEEPTSELFLIRIGYFTELELEKDLKNKSTFDTNYPYW